MDALPIQNSLVISGDSLSLQLYFLILPNDNVKRNPRAEWRLSLLEYLMALEIPLSQGWNREHEIEGFTWAHSSDLRKLNGKFLKRIWFQYSDKMGCDLKKSSWSAIMKVVSVS